MVVMMMRSRVRMSGGIKSARTTNLFIILSKAMNWLARDEGSCLIRQSRKSLRHISRINDSWYYWLIMISTKSELKLSFAHPDISCDGAGNGEKTDAEEEGREEDDSTMVGGHTDRDKKWKRGGKDR